MVLNKNHKKEKSHQSKANLNQGLARGLRQESVCLAALQVSGSERTPPASMQRAGHSDAYL